ncbi:MAG: hypothetical protein ABEJ87_06065 [Candidatus Nanohalobium sp.]
MLKGQTSMEFFLLFGLSMAILSIFFGAVSQKQSNVFERQNRQIAGQVAENVAFQVEMALVQGEGYSRTFSLPSDIAADKITVKVANRTVYVGWQENFVTRDTLYRNRTLQFNTGSKRSFTVLHNSSGVYIK